MKWVDMMDWTKEENKPMAMDSIESIIGKYIILKDYKTSEYKVCDQTKSGKPVVFRCNKLSVAEMWAEFEHDRQVDKWLDR